MSNDSDFSATKKACRVRWDLWRISVNIVDIFYCLIYEYPPLSKWKTLKTNANLFYMRNANPFILIWYVHITTKMQMPHESKLLFKKQIVNAFGTLLEDGTGCKPHGTLEAEMITQMSWLFYTWKWIFPLRWRQVNQNLVTFSHRISSSIAFVLMVSRSRLIVSRSVRSRPLAFQVATVFKPLSPSSRTSIMTDDRTPELSSSTLPVKPLYFVYRSDNYKVSQLISFILTFFSFHISHEIRYCVASVPRSAWIITKYGLRNNLFGSKSLDCASINHDGIINQTFL